MGEVLVGRSGMIPDARCAGVWPASATGVRGETELGTVNLHTGTELECQRIYQDVQEQQHEQEQQHLHLHLHQDEYEHDHDHDHDHDHYIWDRLSLNLSLSLVASPYSSRDARDILRPRLCRVPPNSPVCAGSPALSALKAPYTLNAQSCLRAPTLIPWTTPLPLPRPATDADAKTQDPGILRIDSVDTEAEEDWEHGGTLSLAIRRESATRPKRRGEALMAPWPSPVISARGQGWSTCDWVGRRSPSPVRSSDRRSSWCDGPALWRLTLDDTEVDESDSSDSDTRDHINNDYYNASGDNRDVSDSHDDRSNHREQKQAIVFDVHSPLSVAEGSPSPLPGSSGEEPSARAFATSPVHFIAKPSRKLRAIRAGDRTCSSFTYRCPPDPPVCPPVCATQPPSPDLLSVQAL